MLKDFSIIIKTFLCFVLVAWAIETFVLPRISKEHGQDEIGKVELAEKVKDLAERGDEEAQYMLSISFAEGYGNDKLPDKALEWCLKAAENGYARAQCEIGLRYLYGQGLPKDNKQARFWLEKANEAEDQVVQKVAESGIGVLKLISITEIGEKIKKLQKEAEEGDAEAQYMLSISFAQGYGNEKSSEKALKWCLKAAENGYARAQCEIGLRYLYGQGLPKDNKQARFWLEKAKDAEDREVREAAEKGIGALNLIDIAGGEDKLEILRKSLK